MEVETQLYNSLHLDDEGVVQGLKVLAATSDGVGGLYLDLALLHGRFYTRDETFRSFVQSVKTYGASACVVSRWSVLVCSDVTPVLMSDAVSDDGGNDVVVVVRRDDVMVLSILLPITVGVILKIAAFMIQRLKKMNISSKDNTTISSANEGRTISEPTPAAASPIATTGKTPVVTDSCS